MKDILGTLLGFIIGASLVFFGIIWPDNLSNYYVFKITEYEKEITSMEKTRKPPLAIQQKKEEMEEFKSSIVGSISRFADLKSFGIVGGGAFAALLIAFPITRALKMIMFIFQAFKKDTMNEEFLDVYETVIALAEKRASGAMITDAEIEAIHNDYLRNWMQDFIAVDVVPDHMIKEIISSEIQMYNYRAFEEIDVLNFMGSAAPAFGMVGTVVGLILMLGAAAGEGASIADIMGSMSVALITTLYGVLVAQLIFIPVSSKRYQLKESNIKLMSMIKEGILYLKSRELPEIAGQDLIIYLTPKMRLEIMEQKTSAMRSGDLGL